MRTTRKAFPLKDLIVMTSSGTIDLVASKSALKSLAADPEFDRHYEILLALRNSECELSVADIYEIAGIWLGPIPHFPRARKLRCWYPASVRSITPSFLRCVPRIEACSSVHLRTMKRPASGSMRICPKIQRKRRQCPTGRRNGRA